MEAALAYTFKSGALQFRVRSHRRRVDSTTLSGIVLDSKRQVGTFGVSIDDEGNEALSVSMDDGTSYGGELAAFDEHITRWCARRGLRRAIFTPESIEANEVKDEHGDGIPVDVPAEVLEAADTAARLQARWEGTLQRLFTRTWERRQKVMKQKIASVQFRRGTPLWDPPGETSLASKFDVLVDLDQWDQELRDELESLLPDLYVEASKALPLVEVKAQPDMAAFVRRWIAHALSFNRSVADAVRRILTADYVRTPDVEAAVDDYVAKTARMVGDRVATSIATGATNQAQLETAQSTLGTVEKMWYSAQDGRVRTAHRAASGDRVPLDEPFRLRSRRGDLVAMMHPGDISAPMDLWMNCRCIPGDTPVSGNVAAAMVRPYRGEVIDLTTAGGHKLTATPDHPVLTRRGWVLAGDLHPLDEVFCRSNGDGAGPGPDVEDVPTVQEVFDLLTLTGAWSQGVHASSMNLDGEAADPEVEVVWADGVLPVGPDAALLEELGKLGVSLPHTGVSLPGDETALDWVAHTDQGSLMAPPDGEAKVTEAGHDGAPLDAEAPGHGEDGHPISVKSTDGGEECRPPLPPTGPKTFAPPTDNPPLAEPSVHRADTALGDVSNLLEAAPLGVEPFPLIHLGRRNYDGHVYDLMTEERAFLAGGMVTHNCVMLFVTVTPEQSWLRPGTGLDRFGRASSR